jgi:hypothetical protein
LVAIENHSELGPRISIQSKKGEKLQFPHPLLYAGVPSTHEMLPAIIESTIVAQALCTSTGNLSPIAPYRRLIELGGRGEGVGGRELRLATELQCRIATGKALDPSDDSSVFVADDSEKVNDRKASVNEYLERELEDIENWLKTATAHGSVYSYPVAWEIMPEIRSALRGLNDLVASYEPAPSLESMAERVIKDIDWS